MTKTETREAQTDAAPPGISAGMAAAMMPLSLGSSLAATWLEGVTRMQGEWARFVADRLRKDAEAQHELFACRSPLKAQTLGAAFMHKAVQDYLTEAARISSMGTKVAQNLNGNADGGRNA